MSTFLRGTLIHPALGIFPGKDSSVFQWDVRTHYTCAKFNRRQFSPEELKWPAFYPPLSRITVWVHGRSANLMSNPVSGSSTDDFGEAYISIKDVLCMITRWLNMPLSCSEWDKLSFAYKICAIKSYALRTGAKFDVSHDRDLAQRLVVAFPQYFFPQEIISNPIKNHPDSRTNCGACVQCSREAMYKALGPMIVKFVKFDSPRAINTRLLVRDALPIGCWFKGLTNFGPYLYFMETKSQIS